MLTAIALLLLVAGITTLVVLAGRSLDRQRGSLLRRTPRETRALGRANVTMSRWPGSGGGA